MSNRKGSDNKIVKCSSQESSNEFTDPIKSLLNARVRQLFALRSSVRKRMNKNHAKHFFHYSICIAYWGWDFIPATITNKQKPSKWKWFWQPWRNFLYSLFKWIERHAFNLNWNLISIVYLSIDHKLGGNHFYHFYHFLLPTAVCATL